MTFLLPSAPHSHLCPVLHHFSSVLLIRLLKNNFLDASLLKEMASNENLVSPSARIQWCSSKLLSLLQAGLDPSGSRSPSCQTLSLHTHSCWSLIKMCAVTAHNQGLHTLRWGGDGWNVQLSWLDSHCMMTACYPVAYAPLPMQWCFPRGVGTSWSQKRHQWHLKDFRRKWQALGENAICHSRHRCVGVILYSCSQAEDVVGNCMAPVTERFISACI